MIIEGLTIAMIVSGFTVICLSFYNIALGWMLVPFLFLFVLAFVIFTRYHTKKSQEEFMEMAYLHSAGMMETLEFKKAAWEDGVLCRDLQNTS